MEPHTQLLPAPPHIIGPTWRQTVDGGWYLPERSLGWGIIDWWAEYVLQAGGPHAGEPFLPTLEQARFILWWYALNPDGKFVYRAGLLRRMKGHGKDPLCAAMSLAELSGPVAFSHWDAQTGEPVGKPRGSAWVQIAAVSQDQTRNTFTLFPAMASPKMRLEYGLEINKTIIYSAAGGMIEGVTSSPLSIEGKRPTLVVKNEPQWWLENNNGHSMANVIEGNVTKASYGGCRSLSICNAHRPGEESDAEKDYNYYQDVAAGNVIDTGFLYDALEAPADTPVSEIPPPPKVGDSDYAEQMALHEAGVAKLREGIEIARGDSVWLDVDMILASILDTRQAVSESRRKFLNQVNAAEDSWITPREWDRCQRDVRPLTAGDKITLGFDGSKSSDFTSLVACRIEDAALFPIKTWNPAHYHDGCVPRDDVDAVVHYTFAHYNVLSIRADVREFEAYIDQWSAKYKKQLIVNASPNNPVAFDMRSNQKRFALDCERFLDAVLEQELTHNGSPVLRQHILNAVQHPTIYDAIAIRKASKDSSRKIDAAVCAVLAFAARQEVLMSKKSGSRGAVALSA